MTGEAPTSTSPGSARLLAVARRLYRYRRVRDASFDGMDIFGEPAWDLLLDLYIAGHEKKTISVTSACMAAAVPATTALRWLSLLERNGLLLRAPDAGDRRRMSVTLTQLGIDKMEAFLAQLDAADAATI